MGCGQGKASAPAPVQVQDAAPAPASAAPQSGAASQNQQPLLLGNEEMFTVHAGCIPAGDDLAKEVMLVADAKRKASELPGCKGFCFAGTDEGQPVEVFFKCAWKLVQVDKPWTAFKWEAPESKPREQHAQQTGSEKPADAVNSDLPAETESAAWQAVSQPEKHDQQMAAPVATLSSADEEVTSPEEPVQTSALVEQEEVKAASEESGEKPSKKSKRPERQLCC